jgi:hypothetical protein
MSEVINARRAPWRQGEFLVLLMLANYAEPDGSSIYPSIEKLSLACRLKERQTQNCISSLLRDGVLRVEKKPRHLAHIRTRLFSIDMARVAKFVGCKNCGGAICDDLGCKKQHSGVQSAASHIDNPSRPVLDPSATGALSLVDNSSAPAERDPRLRALWMSIARELGNLKFLDALGGSKPVMVGEVLEVRFGTERRAVKAQDALEAIQRGAGDVRVVIRVAA